MLHLLPIRWILICFAVYCGVVSLGFTRLASLSSVSTEELWYLFKALIGAPGVLIACVYVLWRFVKPVQVLIFPKLGGEWSGHIAYPAGGETKYQDAKLYVKHSFSGVVLTLETE